MSKIKVYTNGCFDILHEGHIKLLKKCKELGDEVYVLINSDESYKKLKYLPLYNTYLTRAKNLMDTGLVTGIIKFDSEEELRQLYATIKPKFLVKGDEYSSNQIIGSEHAENVILVPMLEDYSTTNIKTLWDSAFLITGGLGFIGSNFIQFLNDKGIFKIDIVDNLENKQTWRNVTGKKFNRIYDKKKFYEYLWNDKIEFNYDYIIHLGACSNTHENNFEYLVQNNVDFSLMLRSSIKSKKFIYASSAATYGLEPEDFKEKIDGLEPVNGYGYSKLLLDNTMFNYKKFKNSYGLRFFNVYGPNEWHKGGMMSIISKQLYHDYKFNKDETQLKKLPFQLFKSNSSKYKDGEQKRDFIYVEDVCKVIFHFIIKNDIPIGVYNVGTGVARTFNEICSNINPEREVNYINMSDETSNQYQNFTQADLTKLRTTAKYESEFISLEEGINKLKTIYA